MARQQSTLPELCNVIITTVHVLSLTLTRTNYATKLYIEILNIFLVFLSSDFSGKESKSEHNLISRGVHQGSELNTRDLSGCS